MDEQICENCGFERELNRGLCEGCEAERIATAPLLATIAALESRLAEVERERDAYREKASHLPGLTAELDALRYHYDAAAPEHNLPALLDLYLDRQRQAESERDIALTRAHRIEAAAREAADLLGIVASYVGSEGDAGLGQIKWARDARRVETALRAAMGEEKSDGRS